MCNIHVMRVTGVAAYLINVCYQVREFDVPEVVTTGINELTTKLVV